LKKKTKVLLPNEIGTPDPRADNFQGFTKRKKKSRELVSGRTIERELPAFGGKRRDGTGGIREQADA